jgi:hypothetical protein
MNELLMEEWDEFKRFELFQKSKPPPKVEPEAVDPFKAYTQGPQGNLVHDHKAHGRGYAPEQLEIHSTAPDKRDNRDPEEVYRELVASRNGGKRTLAPDWKHTV